MSKLFFTLTGTRYHYGKEFLKPGMTVQLVKEPDNKYDKEAIVERPRRYRIRGKQHWHSNWRQHERWTHLRQDRRDGGRKGSVCHGAGSALQIKER